MPFSQLSRRWNFCSICRSLASALFSWARVSASRAWYNLHSCCMVSSARSSIWGRPQGMTSSRLTNRVLSKAWPSVQCSCSSCSYTDVVERKKKLNTIAVVVIALNISCYIYFQNFPLIIYRPATFAEFPPAYQHLPPVGCSSPASLVLVPASPQMHGGPSDTPGAISPAPLLCPLPSKDAMRAWILSYSLMWELFDVTLFYTQKF